MKKALGSSIILAVFLAVLTLTAVQTVGSTSFYHLGEENAQFLGGQDSTQEIFAIEGISVTRGEAQTEVQSRMEQGLTQEEAVEQTAEVLVQKKALYARARETGISVSDKEFADYQSSMQESMAKAENQEEIETYFKGFGGEAVYWEIMEPLIRENLVIRKYLNLENEKITETRSMDMTADEVEEQIKRDIYREVYEKVDIESLKSILGELTEQ